MVNRFHVCDESRSPAKTTITPWSVRGRERPTTAAPRHWCELGPGLAQLTATEASRRLATGDPLDD
ncbi:non-homologous end-joining DNA ligase LigD [Cellulomonas iranensis]|uniref:non-homologous end-joining DNA ligase LigD n=1 Tax=Cellulomonas iranensis TaxID=76862 RepID=UPI00385132E4